MEVHEEPLSDEIITARIEDMSEVEIPATHITSSSVHNLLSLDNSREEQDLLEILDLELFGVKILVSILIDPF